MSTIRVCDKCGKKVLELPTFLTVQKESFAPTLADDLTEKNFCDTSCLLEYITEGRGL